MSPQDSRLLLILFLTLVFEGCSSVPRVENEEEGFFDRLALLEAGQTARSRLSGRVHRSQEEINGRKVLLGSQNNRSNSSRKDAQKIVKRYQKLVKGEWVWPLKNVKVTSRYGDRSGKFHDGVDLKAHVGTPVLAAQKGRIAYAGSGLSGYGKLIVIRHPSGLLTVYAHNSKFLVKKGQNVKRGQKIALAGKSGRATGPHLHFEIRKGAISVDPVRLLPGRWTVAEKQKDRS